jgi:hypothetical protein
MVVDKINPFNGTVLGQRLVVSQGAATGSPTLVLEAFPVYVVAWTRTFSGGTASRIEGTCLADYGEFLRPERTAPVTFSVNMTSTRPTLGVHNGKAFVAWQQKNPSTPNSHDIFYNKIVSCDPEGLADPLADGPFDEVLPMLSRHKSSTGFTWSQKSQCALYGQEAFLRLFSNGVTHPLHR